MIWQRVTISDDGDPIGATYRATQLQDQFEKIWYAAGAPASAIAYVGKAHPNSAERHYYFTPAATQLAGSLLKTWGAVDCPPQDKTSLVSLTEIAKI